MGRPLPLGLGAALDDALVEPALERVVRERAGAAARVRRVTSELVKRRTVRYSIELEEAGNDPLHLIGKVYESRSAGEQALAALRWLQDQGFDEREPTRVTVPRAVAFLPELSLLLMEPAGGRSLQRLLRSARARAGDARLFAEALAKLHSFPRAFGPPFTLEDHLEQRCAGLAGSLASAFPELAAPVHRIVATARRAQRDGGRSPGTLAHGDYHPGQVHVHGQRLWLVDLDPLHHGDPAYDVAMVLVVLRREQAEDPGYVRGLREAFLSAYFGRMDFAITERVPLQAALIYLKRACKRFRWRDEPGWEDAVRGQVARAEECLGWHKGLRPPRSLAEILDLGERCPG